MHLGVQRKGWFLSAQGAEEDQQWVPTPRQRNKAASPRAAGKLLGLSSPSPGRVRGGSSRGRAAGFVQHHSLNRSCSGVPGLTLTAFPSPPHPQGGHRPSPLDPTEIPTCIFTGKLQKRLFLPQIEEDFEHLPVLLMSWNRGGNKRLPRSWCPESWGVSPQGRPPLEPVPALHQGSPRAWIPQAGCDLWHWQGCIPQLLIHCSVTHTPDLPSNFLPAQAGGLSLRPKFTEQISAFIEPTVLSKDPPCLAVNWNNTCCLWLLGVVLPFYFFKNLFRSCNAYFSARLSGMLMRFILTVSLTLCPLSFFDTQVLLCCRKWGQQKAADPMNVKIVLKAWNNPALITASWSLLSLHWYLDN